MPDDVVRYPGRQRILVDERLAAGAVRPLIQCWSVSGRISTARLGAALEALIPAVPPLPAESRADPRSIVDSGSVARWPPAPAGPSFQVQVRRTDATEHRIQLAAHPARWDRGSAAAFRQLLTTALRVDADTARAAAERATRAYRDHLDAYRDGTLAAFWRTELVQAPETRIWTRTGGGPAEPVILPLPPSAVEALAALAARAQRPARSVALAALTAYLARWTGHPEVLVAGEADARDLVPAARLGLGPLTDGLLVRIPVSRDATFGAHLHRVARRWARALGAAALPYVHAAGCGPHLSGDWRPTGVSFAYHTGPLGGPGVPLSEFQVEFSGTRGRAVVDAGRVPVAVAREFLDGFAVFLAALRPDVPIAGPRLLSLATEQRLRTIGSAPRVPVPPSIVEQIDTAAGRDPDAPAITFRGVTRSYQALLADSRTLAGRLRAAGARPGRYVALALPCDDVATVAILAVLRSGAAYAPLDLTAPGTWVRDQLAALDPVVALARPDVHGTVREELLAAGVPVLDPGGAADSTPGPLPPPHPDSPAYAMFTSGSTGTPKGVVVSHAALASFSRYMPATVGIRASDRVLGFARLTFDASVLDLLVSFAVGAHVHLIDEPTRVDPTRLGGFLRDGGITVAGFPPTYLPHLDPHGLPALRLMLIGGEAYAGDLIEPWLAAGKEFWNCYGPTETTVIVTVHRCRGGYPGVPPIGRPRPGHRVYVLDGTYRPLPPGAVGELYVSGPSVALGYLNDPARTADRFLPDPLGPGRMYRTGDLVRWGPGEELEYLGRADRQVKVRGHRVELAEVERVLRRHAGVQRAAVVPVRRGASYDALAAFVVPADLSTVELRRYLHGHLPAGSVPEYVLGVDDLPVNASGKLDPAALLARVPGLTGARRRPPNPMERAMLTEVLIPGGWIGPDRVPDPDEDLLGCHLSVAELIEAVDRAADAFGVLLAPGEVLRRPTIAGLTATVEHALSA